MSDMSGTFDTLAVAEELEKSGFAPAQAKALTRAIEFARTVDFSHLATKQDLEALRLTTKQDLDTLRREVKQDIAGVRQDLDTLRRDLTADINTLRRDL